jgi:hypothetical protein
VAVYQKGGGGHITLVLNYSSFSGYGNHTLGGVMMDEKPVEAQLRGEMGEEVDEEYGVLEMKGSVARNIATSVSIRDYIKRRAPREI